ncbi:PepSY domain-containing protein [Blastopirellula sp. JC732]|uniref:PepSY domain-containing protein n=1 Tax=Blastopirellula sediminis TaxID=2894196 RepID=A0A9X1MQM2_9BACT|nr:PepSY domain-containing protein [Blastopirellula sediminis]MCC9605731.1 PepSY domain-containing protein [Blastopirellula sediminis]MCC9630969.1 PepSY domain-containing protein [Blastopirellula sediminis]
MNNPDAPRKRPWPDYRAVWRWHFYAGLFSIPILVVLSISGTIYLFKPQIESWLDKPYDQLPSGAASLPISKQIEATLAAIPGARFHSFELPASSTAATRVIVIRQGERIRCYVDPADGKLLDQKVEEDRFIAIIRRLHGELFLGNRGSYLVELTACWTLVLIFTGLYLWWPRKWTGLGGVLFPRLTGGQKIFWRDIHSVSGIWISGFAIVLILSGLPWSTFWGNYFRNVRHWTGTAVARQDWQISRSRTEKEPGKSAQLDLTAADCVFAAATPLDLPPPVIISPPRGNSTEWKVQSMTQNRPYRADLTIDGASGELTSRQDFVDRHVIDQVVGVGIALHEGQLFGWPNQLLGVVTTSGLILLSASGVILWWRRRDRGVLGAPAVGAAPRFSLGLIVIVAGLAVYLPLFGASLLAVYLAERFVLRRSPGVRSWLGLSNPQSPEVAAV